MSNQIENKSGVGNVSEEEGVVLPPDLEVLLTAAGRRERACIILPFGCGKILLGLEFLRRQSGPSLIVAHSAASAELWAARRRAADGEGSVTEISRDPCAPATVTVTDRATLGSIAADGRLRGMLDALRGGRDTPPAILIEEPYELEATELEVLARICETVPPRRLLSIASRPPCDRSFDERTDIEALCGIPCAAAGIPAMVYRGVLRPHRDFLCLCDPTAMPDDLRRCFSGAVESRVMFIRRLTEMEFMGEVCDRLMGQSAAYLDRRAEEVRAVASLLEARTPEAAARLIGRVGGRLHAPTERDMEKAITYLLQSQAVLSEEEKRILRKLAAENGEGGVLADRRAVWQSVSRSAAKERVLTDVIDTEESVRGRGMRLLVRVSAEDGLRCFGKLLRRGHTPTALLTEDGVCLPDVDGIPERFVRLCRGEADITEGREYAGYVVGHTVSPTDAARAVERLFAAGDIRILLTDGSFCDGELTEQLANVLILTTPTEWRELPPSDASVGAVRLRYATDAREMRERALTALRREDRELLRGREEQGPLHIWHLAAAGEVHASVAEDTDESETVRRFLCCTPSTGWGIPPHIPTGRAGLSAFNAATHEAARRHARAGENITSVPSDESRLCVTVPAAARLPALTPGRVIGLCLAALSMGLGGFLLPHLVRLTVQAQGMPSVLAIFLVLTAIAGGMCAVGGAYAFRTLPYLIRHAGAERSIRSLVQALLRALRETGRIGETVSVRVERPLQAVASSAGDRRFTVRVEGASYAEVELVCRAIAELLSPIRDPRYLILRPDRAWKRTLDGGRRGRAVVFACPSVLSIRDADTDVLTACMRVPLGRSACMYTRRGRGIRALAIARACGYLAPEKERTCEVFVLE